MDKEAFTGHLSLKDMWTGDTSMIVGVCRQCLGGQGGQRQRVPGRKDRAPIGGRANEEPG
jgi:hypothetical protein